VGLVRPEGAVDSSGDDQPEGRIETSGEGSGRFLGMKVAMRMRVCSS
jgi:hypothetical protein